MRRERKWSYSREDLDSSVPSLHEAIERVGDQADPDRAEQELSVRLLDNLEQGAVQPARLLRVVLPGGLDEEDADQG